MMIDTKAYGELDIDERQRITLQKGLFGFEGFTEFALMDSEHPPFYWFQSLDERDIAFVLIDPRVFRPDYSPAVSSEDLEALGILKEGDANLLVFSIVTIPEDQKRMTANLQGPLLINRQTRQGRQIISGDERWHVRHSIIEEMKHAGEDTAC
ncbi:flagellar assembly protein FliW [Marispirochaeta aestuarii]|uniref:flagellar assembly protein FliW n=1 Tax=Marispirochaeta aestuarii TaxID=1963862 RepID=UPI002ABE5AEF|nr:flagellar assembly protein FliW [Marispirochaeta aestuarii]